MPLGYSFSDYVVQIIAGLGTGSVLFLVSAGLTLVFGALRVINFAHGSLTMIGAYVTISLAAWLGFGNAIFWVVLLLAALVVAAGGMFMEIAFFRPIYRRPLLTQLLVTFAFVLIIAGVMRKVYGAATRTVEVPPFLNGGIDVLDGAIPEVPVLLHGDGGRRRPSCSGRCSTGPGSAARSARPSPTPCCSVSRASTSAPSSPRYS